MFQKSRVLAVLFLGLASSTFGQIVTEADTSTSSIRAPGFESTTEILESLRVRQSSVGNIWIPQSELDPLIREDGGGACPSAAALIAYQTMRKIAGLDVDANPHQAVLHAFAQRPDLLKGRLTNKQLVDVLRLYGKRLEGATIDVRVLSAPNSIHAEGGEVWTHNRLPEIAPQPGEVMILSYTFTKESGEVLGRHFVVLKSRTDNQINIVDPTAPTSDRRYVLEHSNDNPTRVFLKYPPDLPPRPVTLELNTIFSVAVHPVESSGRLIPTESTPADRIKMEIDRLAHELTERNELRSPRVWRTEGAHVGLPALDLPSTLGGANWPASKMLEIFKHAGRYDLNLRDVVGAAHGRLLLKSQSTGTRDILQQVADGAAYIAIAITEPSAGSDFTAMQSTCTKVEGGYRLNGVKRFNARLDQATHVIVFTKSNTGKEGRLNVFVLPIDAPGLEIERFAAHGLTGNSYGGLTMTEVFVPDSHRIGDEDAGYQLFNEHFRYWRLMQTAAALGTAERALEMMAERLQTRHVNGKPIGRFTHLQQPLGEYSIKLRMAHELAKEAATLLDRDELEQADILICGLKAEGVEIALGAVDAATRAFGGEGYSGLVDIGGRLRDLTGLRIADGTTDVMRSAVVSKTYGRQFWKMAIESEE